MVNKIPKWTWFFIDIGELIKQFPQHDVIWVNIEKKGPTKWPPNFGVLSMSSSLFRQIHKNLQCVSLDCFNQTWLWTAATFSFMISASWPSCWSNMLWTLWSEALKEKTENLRQFRSTNLPLCFWHLNIPRSLFAFVPPNFLVSWTVCAYLYRLLIRPHRVFPEYCPQRVRKCI